MPPPVSPVAATPTRGNRLLDAPILPTLLRLSAPNMIAMIANAGVAMVETALAGSIGTAALAAFAIVFPMAMLQQMMSAGAMGGGISSAVSRSLGAGDHGRASALALHAVIIGLLSGLVFSALFLAFGREIFGALGARGAILDLAVEYGTMVFAGSVSIWLTNTLASILRGTGNMRVPSMTLLGASLGQMGLSAIFALGLLDLPKLGMRGIGLGQLVAWSGSTVVFLVILTGGRQGLRLSLRPSLLSRKLFADILKVGAIAVISPVQSVLAVLITTRLMATRGAEALAGYGIGARLEFLLVPIVFAIGVASVPMVGTAIGAKQSTRARAVAWTAGLVAAGGLGIIGIAVAFVPTIWSRLYSNDAQVLLSAATYFAYAGPAYAFYGLGLALYFASQGSGQILGAVLAQSLRLGVIACGASWLSGTDAPPSALFALIAGGMVAYGVASAIALQRARWN